MLVASGNDPKTVQERMGHVDIERTLDFYAMTTEEASRRATGAIVQFFAQGKTPKH
jgi:site-specific recombinase XerD